MRRMDQFDRGRDKFGGEVWELDSPERDQQREFRDRGQQFRRSIRRFEANPKRDERISRAIDPEWRRDAWPEQFDQRSE